jgi:sugar lactone lactonase YvrE
LYDVSVDRWSNAPKIPAPVGRGTAAVLLKDGRVLVTGGGTGCGDVYASATLFDPYSNSWARTTSMDVPEQFHIAALLHDGRALVSGAATSVYNPITAAWMPPGDPRPLIQAPCEGDVRKYGPALRRDSLIERATHEDCSSVTVLPAGATLVAGGLSGASDTEQGWVRVNDLDTGDDVPSWPMQVARAGHTATRLTNGVVLIAGGRVGAGARLSSSELYIPRLPYKTSVIPTPRGAYNTVTKEDVGYGEWLAAATTARATLLISYRGGSGPSHLLEWEPRWSGDPRTWSKPRNPPYLRALAPDAPPLNSIRIDDQQNIWGVSSDAQEIVKISADGEVLLRFGNPSSSDVVDPSVARRQRLASPSDLALDQRGNVFVTDAGERPRIIKFDSGGRFVAATGRKGSQPGELDRPRSIATDAGGNVYVADSGNARIQVFDNSLNLHAVYLDVGTPWALCIPSGSRQFLYSVSNPELTRDARTAHEIYKLELDGTILGKAVGEQNPLSTLDHLHCLDPNTFVAVGHRAFHAFTFAQGVP